MRRAGQIAIVQFPTVALNPGKPRPVLLLAPVPGPYDDWLVCMLSTQQQQAVAGFDEVVELGVAGDADYLVTHNVRDFAHLQLRFPQLKIRMPKQFLQEVAHSCPP